MNRIYLDRRDLHGDVSRFLDLLEDGGLPVHGAPDYRPPLDVVETAETIEVVADLPGVAADAIRILFSGGTLILAGRKHATACGKRETTFHLAERSFGRFAVGVRVTVAIDAGRARATLRAGELRVILPRIPERRGADIAIPVELDSK